MTCAAVSTGIAIMTRNPVTSIDHTMIGMRIRLIPLQRRQRMVTMRLMPVAMEPKPLIRIPRIQ